MEQSPTPQSDPTLFIARDAYERRGFVDRLIRENAKQKLGNVLQVFLERLTVDHEHYRSE